MYLLQTLTIFFTLLAIPLVIDHLFNATITGRGLGASAALGFAYSAFIVLRERQRRDEAARQNRLRRSALLADYLNGRRISLVLVALLIPLVAHAGDTVHIDAALTEATAQLFPLVPLTKDELADLQQAAFSVAVLARATADYPVDMDPATRERRASVKRQLQAVHEKLVDIQVMQAGAVILATRKGGAR